MTIYSSSRNWLQLWQCNKSVLFWAFLCRHQVFLERAHLDFRNKMRILSFLFSLSISLNVFLSVSFLCTQEHSIHYIYTVYKVCACMYKLDRIFEFSLYKKKCFFSSWGEFDLVWRKWNRNWNGEVFRILAGNEHSFCKKKQIPNTVFADIDLFLHHKIFVALNVKKILKIP